MINHNVEIEKLMLASSELIKKSIYLSQEIKKTINVLVKCIKRGNKVILFGNGGSAADAQHIAAELVGRYQNERKSYPALSLTSDSAILTSLSNDYSYDLIFSRQCEAFVKKGDVVIGISTSGNSKNVKKGLIVAKKNGAITVGLLGNKGGILKNFVDIPIIVNSSSTPQIQEVHRVIYHIICKMVETNLMQKKQ